MTIFPLFRICLIFSIFFIFLYFKSRKTLISIQYAGGVIAFNVNWFPQSEIEDFQRQLRIAKDNVTETSNTLMTTNMSDDNYSNNQNTGTQMGKADELMKYGQLLKSGLITQEEFENIKRNLL